MSYASNHSNKETIFDQGDVIEGSHVKALYDMLGSAPHDVHSTMADRLNAMNQLETFQDPNTQGIEFRVSRPSWGIDSSGGVYFAPTASDLTAGEEAVVSYDVTTGELSFIRFDEIR